MKETKENDVEFRCGNQFEIMEVIANYRKTRAKLLKEAQIIAHSKYLEMDGLFRKIHYLELGKGRPLILVHGGLSHSSEWINILKPLAEHYHVYAVDRPGHGLTDSINYRGVDFRQNATAFIHSFMEGIGLSSAVLIGNSMGGYFSICYALKYPLKVDRLVLLGAPAGLNRWIPTMLRILGIKGLNRFLMKTVARPSISSHKKVYKKLLVTDIAKISRNYLAHSCENQLLPGALDSMAAMLESVLTLKGWRKKLCLVDELKYLEMPVHFIWGDQDAFEFPDTGIKKASLIPEYTFDIIENAGHCPWLDQAEECVVLILSRLKD